MSIRRGETRLYSGPMSMFGAKAEIAILEKGIDCEVVMVPFGLRERYEPKHAVVVRINPKRQVPVLIDADVEIFDSTQIFEYLEELRPEPALWPTSPAARARARLLEHKSDEVFFPHIIRLMSLQATPQDPAALTACTAANRYYNEMERLLAGNAFLAGSYGFADIAFYLAQLFGAMLGAPIGNATPRLVAWRERMTARPAVAQVVGAMAAFMASQGLAVPAFLSPVLRSGAQAGASRSRPKSPLSNASPSSEPRSEGDNR
ncbi:glutathione S-transferase [Rhizobiales bacterium GAS188]|nr:glutathione S-transferase [Rhizobiales bacterium GAS188]